MCIRFRHFQLTQTLSDVSFGYKNDPAANVSDDTMSQTLMASSNLWYGIHDLVVLTFISMTIIMVEPNMLSKADGIGRIASTCF